MSAWIWGPLAVLAIPTALVLLALVAYWVDDLISELQHRFRVREAVKQGWQVPTINGDWELLDNGAPMQGVTAIKKTPTVGVKITHWAAHAKKVQRQVEKGWLAGIELGKVRHENEATP